MSFNKNESYDLDNMMASSTHVIDDTNFRFLYLALSHNYNKIGNSWLKHLRNI